MKDSFKEIAKRHQIKFRNEVLKVGFDTYETWLIQPDGEKGLNFYNGFNVFGEVKNRYPNYRQGLYADILRSEHIPFNYFIPLSNDKVFCKNILNDFFDGNIKSVEEIKIEYAPPSAEKYLNDKTSFDAYIEFTHINAKRGIIGVEVKYTEKEYALKPNSKEEIDIKNPESIYYKVSALSNLYKKGAEKDLPTDKFRQIWRNHLLGESILLNDGNKFQLFSSITLFPEGNLHFVETSKEYIGLLNKNEHNFLPITYEDFLSSCKKHSPDDDYKAWTEYMTERYIVK